MLGFIGELIGVGTRNPFGMVIVIVLVIFAFKALRLILWYVDRWLGPMRQGLRGEGLSHDPVSPAPKGKVSASSAEEQAEFTQMMALLDKMDRRIDNLETIVIDKDRKQESELRR